MKKLLIVLLTSALVFASCTTANGGAGETDNNSTPTEGTKPAESTTPTENTPENDTPAVTYTVTFNSAGGSEVASQTVTAGSTVTKPADPIKNLGSTSFSYVFLGWFNGNTEYNFSNAVNSDLTLTARWQDVLYIQIKNAWSGRVLVPFKTSEVEYKNCVIVQEPSDSYQVTPKLIYNPNVLTYPCWIVHPAIADDSEGYFSLEAADKDGNASGLYLYCTNTPPEGKTNYDVDATGWGSGNKPHCFYADLTQIGNDNVNACFKFDILTGKDQLSGCSPFYIVKTLSGKYLWSGNSNPCLKENYDLSSVDYSWCYKIYSLE